MVDGGILRVAADTDAVLAVLDAEAAACVSPEPAGRAIVADDDERISIVVYSADRLIACAVLIPTQLIRCVHHASFTTEGLGLSCRPPLRRLRSPGSAGAPAGIASLGAPSAPPTSAGSRRASGDSPYGSEPGRSR
jgi:hypothetical protein